MNGCDVIVKLTFPSLKDQKQKPKACNFIKKETLAQVFSCEFCEISKNTFFTEHLWATASERAKSVAITYSFSSCTYRIC